MPLIKSKSKKAFSKNVEAEMHAGKPQNQSLAIAYSVKRKAKKASGGTVESGSRDMNMADGGSSDDYQDGMSMLKDLSQQRRQVNEKDAARRKSKGLGIDEAMHQKNEAKKRKMGMAEGGEVTISAKVEKRPMPNDTHGDSDETRRNSGDKASSKDSWTDRSTVTQAQRPSITKLSQPRMVADSPLRRSLRNTEGDLMDMDAPESDKAQPSRMMDEKGPNRQGTKVHPMKMMANGGMADPDHDDNIHNKAVDDEYGDGAEEDRLEHPAGLTEDDDERTLPVDEYMSTNRMSPMLAEGGHIEESEDNYADDGEHDSIAAAIMSRRNRLHDEIDSGAHDMDLAAAYAEGGEVDLHANHEEEPNNEDQMSFQALKKENYNSSNLDMDQPEDSNMTGDEREDETHDKNDRVGAIRSRMNTKRQFKQR